MKYTDTVNATRLLIDENKTVDSIRLIGVTKYLNLPDTENAIISGLTDIGENRLQTAENKILALKPKYPYVKWHFLGRLQTNKLKKIIKLFDYIHSVESYEKLLLIDKICVLENKKINVLLQIDASGEESKQGMSTAELLSGAKNILSLKKTKVLGLMTMAPYTQNKVLLKQTFKSLKSAQIMLEEKNIHCPELSMGMSNDYLIALQEGATMVRLGTILFIKEENND